MAYKITRHLFVGNLPWTIGQREFYEYFTCFGPVVYHNIPFDKKTGLSKKYGFIQFGNEDGYREVYKQKTHILEGNQLQISEQRNSRGASGDNSGSDQS